ncbi:HAD family phosphatase [Bifidobacterium sp. MA2]|uniref:HAD family phosphatase n=1 Tax=Bifidobacterium santillanense TaxID=2809028 RepID=A0ABS5UQI7_9BIFI|nr:HAD family phosphatase [Bifidobacterium santillanense]MBT1173104.1 HAD family phosphatase [Bifidobacterium santillanense]
MLLKAVFWDLDGTLIDSEPLWHDGEMEIAAANGGRWSEELGWECSGTPVPDVARRMIEHGCTLSVEEIDRTLKQYVFDQEKLHMPWIDGVLDTLRSLKEAGVPSMLVSTSPRPIVENVLAAAPGLFAGYVCGDDDAKHKPDPAPYLLAASKLGIATEDMAKCAVLEDTMVGLTAGAASGATTIAQTCTIRTDTSNGPQFASIDGYEGIDAAAIDAFVRQRATVE